MWALEINFIIFVISNNVYVPAEASNCPNMTIELFILKL